MTRPRLLASVSPYEVPAAIIVLVCALCLVALVWPESPMGLHGRVLDLERRVAAMEARR